MIYNRKEFLNIKPRRNTYLQTFNVAAYKSLNASKCKLISPKQSSNQQAASRNNSLWRSLKQYLREYCVTSSMHCFHYFASNKLRLYEKVIWFVIILAMSVCCIIVYYELTELYYSQIVQTTVADSVYPIFILPFPSVGICLRNRIDWHRLYYKAAEKFLPPNVDNQTLNTFYRFFENFSDIKFYTLQKFATLFEPANSNVNLTLIDNVNVLQVLEYLAFSCDEVFDNVCMWRYKAYNCCELFTLDRTEMGFCYTFNSAINEVAQEKVRSNPFYPYHNSYSGEGSGLQVTVLLDENKMKPGLHVVNGIYIMIKKNDEWNADVKFINHNTFTKVSLTAQLTETDKRLRRVAPDKRGCLFEDETSDVLFKKIPDLKYWRGNCRTRCHQEHVLKYCKCNLSPLFPNHKSDNFTSCKPSDFKCIYEHSSLFGKETQFFESKYIHDVDNESMTCNCLNSCNLLWYHAFYTSFPLERTKKQEKVEMINLDVHYQSSTLLKYRSAVRYTLVELLANFGGIVGLFLGASLLSAVELIYYFTIGLFVRLREQPAKKDYDKRANTPAKPKLIKITTIEPREVYKY